MWRIINPLRFNDLTIIYFHGQITQNFLYLYNIYMMDLGEQVNSFEIIYQKIIKQISYLSLLHAFNLLNYIFKIICQ